jgi:hypothetical protein
MTIRNLQRRYWHKGNSSITKAGAKVAPELNPSAEGGVLFWIFFEQAKKNINI